MPKTKDAFALRWLDSNILYFDLPPMIERNADVETKRQFCRQLMKQEKKFFARRCRIARHLKRLSKYLDFLYRSAQDLSDDDYVRLIRPKSNRVSTLSDKYASIAQRCNATENIIAGMTEFVENEMLRPVVKTFGEQLREARKKMGLTQAELAESLGTKRGNIAAYEQGRNEPTISFLHSACQFFGRSADSFLGYDI